MALAGFNGASLFQVRKGLEIITFQTSKQKLQWGRTFSSAERPLILAARERGKWASMGPHFFKCGKERTAWLQWGRTFSSAERSTRICVGWPFKKASMGPHFFKCGKLGVSFRWQPPLDELQWGRTFSSAESSAEVFACLTAASSFNGAALFQVRKVFRRFRGGGVRKKLQWGRTFSSAESRQGRQHGVRVPLASMGPHFFKCGKNRHLSGGLLRADRFNGAALFQVRKDPSGSPSGSPSSPLQWGRTFSSAESSPMDLITPLDFSLQWGRTFSSAERGGAVGKNRWRRCSFNGAALFQVRKGATHLS